MLSKVYKESGKEAQEACARTSALRLPLAWLQSWLKHDGTDWTRNYGREGCPAFSEESATGEMRTCEYADVQTYL